MNNLFKILSGVAAVLATLIFFYPTPYSYEDGGLTRVNRFTGKVQKSTADGWIDAESAPKGPEDTVTPKIKDALGKVSIVAQDFDTVTVNNPGPWNLFLIEKGEVVFGGSCENATDYVDFVQIDRSWDPGKDVVVHLSYPERFKRQLLEKCGGSTAHRSLTFIINSAFTKDENWDAQTRIVSRKVEGDVALPAAPK